MHATLALHSLIMAAIEASPSPTPSPTPFSIPAEAWTAIGVLATAVVTVIGGILLHNRSRYAVMEREIRKLRAYSWVTGKKLEKRVEYLEALLDAYRDFVDELENHIHLELPPPPPRMKKVLKPSPASVHLDPQPSMRELEKEIEEILSEAPDGETGPLDIV